MQITKENIKVGMTIWCAIDDRPIELPSLHKGMVTEIFDDHYLYTEFYSDGNEMCTNVWGFYDDDNESSCVNFTTLEAAETWLRKRGVKKW